MKSKFKIFSIFSSSLLLISAAAGCSDSKKNVDHSGLPEDVKPAALAIITDSAQQFAAAVNYPLERPYPLQDIIDSAEMVKYYPTLVDDSLKNKVLFSPDSLWTENGWRGWTLDNGEYLWIDAGKVYQFNYISKREKVVLDSLRNEEITSLDPSLRKGWTPVLCIIDSIKGKIFRIDSDETGFAPNYRLAGYSTDMDLSGLPSIVLYGNVDMEGSMETRLYHFEDSIGNKADYSPDIISDEDTVQVIQIIRHGEKKRYKVKRGYWLEILKRKDKQNQQSSKDNSSDFINTIPSLKIKQDTVK